MDLQTLPDEILILIFKHLDTRSIHSVYSACARFQDITIRYALVESCDLTLSVLATAETLETSFFRDISKHVQQLNLCGVCNLDQSILLQAIRMLYVLNKLDVTYTNITLTDFIDIYKACPTITDISINFDFGKLERKVELSSFHPYQEVFENILNVHFVGDSDVLMGSQSPGLVLKKAKLKKLQYTIIDCDSNKLHAYNSLESMGGPMIFDNFVSKISTTKFKVPSVSPKSVDPLQNHREDKSKKITNYSCMYPFSSIHLYKYEAIIINRKSLESPNSCYATSQFESFFGRFSLLHTAKNNFEMITAKSYHLHIQLFGNLCVMLWNKLTTIFDDKFYSDLWCTLQPYFPCYFDPKSHTPIAYEYDLFVTQLDVDHENEGTMDTFKRKRTDPPNCSLDFDAVFEEQNRVQLSIFLDISTKEVTLSTNCNYLKKLTYLSLSGQVEYSDNFFDVLFRCCDNLTTLSMISSPFWSCSAAIARSLPLSHSIKNILIIDAVISFNMLFSSMSQCKTLENVHLFDTSVSVNFSDPLIVFENCSNLYCMCVYINSSVWAKNKCMKVLESLPNEKKIFFKLLPNDYIVSDPYTDMYKIHYLKKTES